MRNTTTTVVIAAGAVLAAVIVTRTPGQQEVGMAGACCLPTGCFMFTEAQCASFGGTFVGGTCTNITCHVGACCFPDFSCSDEFFANCDSQGGFFWGQGTSCGAVSLCGLCCLPNGSCDFPQSMFGLPISECNGEFHTVGVGINCNTIDCHPSPVGACCLADANCQINTESDCISACGTWAGDGTICGDFDMNGVDDVCESACRSDSNNDGVVGIIDFLTLLEDWGSCK